MEFEFGREDLKRLQELSRLDIPEGEEEQTLTELRRILAFMERLSAVKDADEEGSMPVGALRADEPAPAFDREALMRNAKRKKDGAYLAPQTVE